MSQAENKVSWCMAKAKKEIADGKTHRGLIRAKSDIEESKKHIAKAEHNFKAILTMQKTGFPDWSVSAAFYTIYHCFLAIIKKHGYDSRNQECTIALIEYLNEQKIIDISTELVTALKTTDIEELQQRTVIGLRENFQYGTETSVKEKHLEELKILCRQAIEEAKEDIYGSSKESLINDLQALAIKNKKKLQQQGISNKDIITSSRDNIDKLMQRTQEFAKKKGLTQKDLDEAVKRARK